MGYGAVVMTVFCTVGSGTMVSVLMTGRRDCTLPPVPLLVTTRPAYSCPEPASGVIITEKAALWADPPPLPSWATMLWPALICTTCGVPAGPAAPIWVIRADTARPGADSTSWEARPLPARSYATTPCSSSGSEAAVKTPGAPRAPPDSIADAVTGTSEDSVSAAGTPDSDGSTIAAAEPPGMSSPVLPAGG